MNKIFEKDRTHIGSEMDLNDQRAPKDVVKSQTVNAPNRKHQLIQFRSAASRRELSNAIMER